MALSITGTKQQPPQRLGQLLLAFFVFLPAFLLALLLLYYQTSPQLLVWQWVPSLGVNLNFRLDGLSALFAMLITGVGFLVQLYSLAYMQTESRRVLFHGLLCLFMLAMLGLVLADNLIMLFVFWELTTLSSYLLIGFNHEAEKARNNALQALLITAIGGLVLLAGFILLGEIAGSYSISQLLQKSDTLSQHPWFVASMVCIIIGAFSKSAQWPLHFWLPGAMAAPTPVSAYLHSATMVKAGVFLLARLLPIYGQHELWQAVLCTIGGFTALWCALLAFKQTDLKLILAYSTNVILAQLIVLIGIGTSYAVTAALLLIAAHSFYKAGLFMVVGNIDKAAGTREYHELAGLKSVLAISFGAAIITGASKAGLPPSFGFISKEYIYKAGLEFGWLLSFTMLAVNAIMVALALLILIKPFMQKANHRSAALKTIEHQSLLWFSPMVLAVLSALVPVVLLAFYQEHIINPGAAVMLNNSPINNVKLWSGFNMPLALSVATVFLGVLLYSLHKKLGPLVASFINYFGTGSSHFETFMKKILAFASRLTATIQHGRLSLYSLQFMMVLSAVLIIAVLQVQQLPVLKITGNYYEILLAVLVVACAILVVVARTLLLSVVALAAIGFLTTLIFLIYSAPDVAKTQLLVETLIVVFIAIVMRYLPRLNSVPRHSLLRRIVHIIIASSIGLCVAFALWLITATPMDQSIADFYRQNAVTQGFGRNIVNVILVDFRAFDTLGEAVVVIVAALATVATLASHKYRHRNNEAGL